MSLGLNPPRKYCKWNSFVGHIFWQSVIWYIFFYSFMICVKCSLEICLASIIIIVVIIVAVVVDINGWRCRHRCPQRLMCSSHSQYRLAIFNSWYKAVMSKGLSNVMDHVPSKENDYDVMKKRRGDSNFFNSRTKEPVYQNFYLIWFKFVLKLPQGYWMNPNGFQSCI